MNPRYYSSLMSISAVTRYHGEIGPMPQSIAAHSWGVAWLIMEFWPEASKEAIKYALEHDLPEHETSDISYVAKLRYPPLKKAIDEVTEKVEADMGIAASLSWEEHWWVKWADLVEGSMWCRYQYKEWGFGTYLERWNGYLRAVDRHCSRDKVPESYADNAMAKNMIRMIKE